MLVQLMLRQIVHLIEEDLKRFGANIPSKRILGEAFVVCNALTFNKRVSPYNAHTGRQPPMLPDLENADFDAGGDNHNRGQRIRQVGLELPKLQQLRKSTEH